MKPNTPRTTSAQWHEGQFSALYAYSSTGTVLPGLAAEIKQCLNLAQGRDYKELAQLYVKVAPVPTIAELEGQQFWNRYAAGSDGLPARCRSNGKLKTWKTRSGNFRLPVKYELKNCFYLTPDNIDYWVIAP